MLKELTKEQEALADDVKNEWIDRLKGCELKLDKDKAADAVKWLYKLSDFAEPKIEWATSPSDAQAIANRLNDTKDVYYNTASYGSIRDYGWVSFYDFFERIGILKHDNFNKFKELLKSGIYDMIQFDEVAIISPMPIFVSYDINDKIHNENDFAIKWDDGYGVYFWRGVAVSEKLIKHPETYTKKDIISESNAELRRCIMEKLGPEEYSNRLGLIELDSDTDLQGNIQTLYRTEEKDTAIDEFIYFAKVVCPSTDRNYFLCVPPDVGLGNNIWDAVAFTFGKTKEEYKPDVET